MRIPQFTLEPYWSIPNTQLFADYVTSESGLTTTEALRRAEQYGKNQVSIHSQSAWKLFAKKCASPLVLILLFANTISAFLGEITSSLIIAVILLASIFLDFFQEYQANKIAEKLQKRVSLTANVLRDGKIESIPATHLTYGDVIVLAPGNVVPADARLISVNELHVDQSILTGEPTPQLKHLHADDVKTELHDRKNAVFMGTVVMSGQGMAVVTRIGEKTELGRIGKLLSEPRAKTEFLLGIDHFSTFLLKITFTLVLFVFFVLAFFKHDVLQSFLFALAIAIGLTPELLPMILTITLSKSAFAMSKKGMIVKHLPSLQSLGSIDVLCTDKTGTLTEGIIVLESAEDADQKDSKYLDELAWLNSSFQTSIHNFLDVAILKKLQFSHLHEYTKKDEVHYDYHRKRVSVVVEHEKELQLLTKGAAESVLSICHSFRQKNRVMPLTTPVREKLIARLRSLNQKGIRVLAVASKPLEKKSYDSTSAALEEMMTFEGFLLFRDKPKESAAAAIKKLLQKHVEIKVLTGDEVDVTEYICKELGLPVSGIVTAKAMHQMSEAQLMVAAKKASIFAELTPEDKRRIISVLKKSKLVVGFLGDGINDAPSLHAADVGISVNTGTDVAKESADLILLHQDLHVLKDGVIEGRKSHANVMKYALMGTSSNFGNMVSVTIAAVALPFIPILPIQLLLNDLLYDVSQLALPYDTVDAEQLEKPHRWDIRFIQKFMLIFGSLNSMFDLLAGAVLLLFLHATPEMFRTGVFIESLLTQSFVLFSIRTKKVPFLQSKVSRAVVLSMFVVISVGLLLPSSPLASLFQFVRLPIIYYAFLAVMIALYVSVVEMVKKWFYEKANG